MPKLKWRHEHLFILVANSNWFLFKTLTYIAVRNTITRPICVTVLAALWLWESWFRLTSSLQCTLIPLHPFELIVQCLITRFRKAFKYSFYFLMSIGNIFFQYVTSVNHYIYWNPFWKLVFITSVESRANVGHGPAGGVFFTYQNKSYQHHGTACTLLHARSFCHRITAQKLNHILLHVLQDYLQSELTLLTPCKSKTWHFCFNSNNFLAKTSSKAQNRSRAAAPTKELRET